MKATRPLKIVLTGPESTGKTSLSISIAKYFNTLWNPEYARFYLSRLGRPYQYHDITNIAKGQIAWEFIWYKQCNQILVCDTGILVPKVWSLFQYGKCDKWIEKTFKKNKYDFYFLCGADFPWVYDPLRENPTNRAKIFEMYKLELEQANYPYIELNGDFATRESKIIEVINHLIHT